MEFKSTNMLIDSNRQLLHDMLKIMGSRQIAGQLPLYIIASNILLLTSLQISIQNPIAARTSMANLNSTILDQISLFIHLY